MKIFLRVLLILGGLLALAKLAQIVVDYLYENYGRRYVTTESDE